nr:MAG: innexin [Metapenaeopsis lamellata majanivirus]
MIPISFFSNLRGLIKINKYIDIESIAFKLQFRVTTTLLFFSCLLLTTYSLTGDPISCVYDGENPILKEHVINTYCWIHSTFTLSKYIDKAYGEDTHIPHPGIGHYGSSDNKTYHAYYQWVPFVLFIQAIVFYLPHALWKTWEGGKIESITSELTTFITNEENQQQKKINHLVDYLLKSRYSHNFYVIKYLFCELLNIMINITNLILLNKFLNGMFFKYGTDILTYSYEKKTELFPKVTKCSFNLFGPSGTVQKHDFLCILALNVLNEKNFLILWVWFMFLIVFSVLSFMLYLLFLSVPYITSRLILKRDLRNFGKMGDYFLIYLIYKNIEKFTFEKIIDTLILKMSEQDAYTNNDNINRNSCYYPHYKMEEKKSMCLETKV